MPSVNRPTGLPSTSPIYEFGARRDRTEQAFSSRSAYADVGRAAWLHNVSRVQSWVARREGRRVRRPVTAIDRQVTVPQRGIRKGGSEKNIITGPERGNRKGVTRKAAEKSEFRGSLARKCAAFGGERFWCVCLCACLVYLKCSLKCSRGVTLLTLVQLKPDQTCESRFVAIREIGDPCFLNLVIHALKSASRLFKQVIHLFSENTNYTFGKMGSKSDSRFKHVIHVFFFC